MGRAGICPKWRTLSVAIEWLKCKAVAPISKSSKEMRMPFASC
jgi:hypothetical protein